MKLPFINEGIFKPHKSLVEKEEFCCVCIYTHVCYFKFVNFIYFGFCALSLILLLLLLFFGWFFET